MELYVNGYFEWVNSAPSEFRRALNKGRMEAFFGRITGRPYRLLAFETVKKDLNLITHLARGRKEIRLERIIGSVGRYEQFSRALMPLDARLENRWRNIYHIAQRPRGFPPIQVYQVGEDYFILDGHHRASVARYLGYQHIEAQVIEWIVIPN